MEAHDCVVIGAGWYGLAAAKTYIELHPEQSIVVLDAAASVGGTWAQHRLYPGLLTNHTMGNYEFSDFPMDPETYGVAPAEHIPGAVIHRYLANYAQHFGVYQRIRFNTKVEAVEPSGEGWKITTAQGKIDTRKLIIATGLTSEAFIPRILGDETFGGPIFHSKDLQQHATDGPCNISILGGAKSAWDAAYAYASSSPDVSVDLIVRKSGNGPVWMIPSSRSPLRLERLVQIRFISWFSPCIWGDEDGYRGIRGFLHNNWLGRKIVNLFWKLFRPPSATDLDKHPEVKKLVPWKEPFWTGNRLGILNYPTDFFHYVRNGQIRVHVADITHLSEKTVHLSNGAQLKAEALLCATGWTPTPPIHFPPGSDAKSDMPHYEPDPSRLEQRADATVLERFPLLKAHPRVTRPENPTPEGITPNQPFRLYRFIVPPQALHNHNIAFAGMAVVINNAMNAQTQALWISAYLDNKLELGRLPLTVEEAQYETVLHTQFGKWRSPCGYGARFPDLVFDAMPYTDMLLRDLGLETRRKKGWLAEVFTPYGPEDYRGLSAEWLRRHS